MSAVKSDPIAPGLQRFYEHVLPWVRKHGEPDASSVTNVKGNGSDWDGSTEEGFYSSFSVTIQGQRQNGQPFWRDVTGEELESLWKWTVREVFGD